MARAEATADMPVAVATTLGVSPALGSVGVWGDAGAHARRRTSIRVMSSTTFATGPNPATQPRLRTRRTPVPAAIAGAAPPTPPSGLGVGDRPFLGLPRRRAAGRVRVERCAKCDALRKSFGSNVRECCRAAGLTEASGRARVAIGAAAIGGAAAVAYGAYGGSGGGRGGGGKGGGGGNGGGGDGGGFARRAAEPSAADAAAARSRGLVEEVVLLDVRGMHCGGCTANVKRILEMEPACVSAAVNLANESALVRVAVRAGGGASDSPGAGDVSVPEADIARAVRAVGDSLAAVVTSQGFPATVREACGVAVAGVSASDAASSKREERLRRIEASTKRVVVAWALAASCLIGHAAHMFHHSLPALKVLCSTPVHAGLSVFAMLGPGRETLVDGWRALRSGGPNMNTLVSLGALASFGMSAAAVALPRLGWPTFFEEPVMLLAFVLLGRAVEERAKLRATSDMSALLNLLPATARLVSGGAGGGSDAGSADASSYFREVPTNALIADDLILVLPGDRIPVDGVVAKGTSQVDEAAINGEPIPRPKAVGDAVAAGTVNCDGAITVRVVSSGEATQVAGIVRMVEAAQQREAPVQRLADEVSGKFVYGVMGASAATFAFWSLAGTKLFPQVLQTAAFAATAAGSPATAPLLLGLQMAASVLVVACPCALGLATPTAVLVGTSLGARHGLLIRGGDVLERAHKLDCVVFDKTGTLTVGRPRVTRVLCGDARDGDEDSEDASGASSSRKRGDSVDRLTLLSAAAAVERNSRHPLAMAVVAAAEDAAAPTRAVADETFRQTPGKGAVGTVDGVSVAVGTRAFCESFASERDAKRAETGSTDSFAAATEAVAARRTPVFVAFDGEVVGVLEMEDEIRNDARQTVARLKKRGVRVMLLSGDRQETAGAVGAALGVDAADALGDIAPEGKASKIAELKSGGARVAMVGDGINDAAALAEADVGIAMAGGVGAASEVASIVLLGDRPSQVVDALELSHATFGKIEQNLCWAFAYNLIGIPIAAGALLPLTGLALTPSVAGGLMGFSSLGVMANSLLLRLAGRRLSKPPPPRGAKLGRGNAPEKARESETDV